MIDFYGEICFPTTLSQEEVDEFSNDYDLNAEDEEAIVCPECLGVGDIEETLSSCHECFGTGYLD